MSKDDEFVQVPLVVYGEIATKQGKLEKEIIELREIMQEFVKTILSNNPKDSWFDIKNIMEDLLSRLSATDCSTCEGSEKTEPPSHFISTMNNEEDTSCPDCKEPFSSRDIAMASMRNFNRDIKDFSTSTEPAEVSFPISELSDIPDFILVHSGSKINLAKLDLFKKYIQEYYIPKEQKCEYYQILDIVTFNQGVFYGCTNKKMIRETMNQVKKEIAEKLRELLPYIDSEYAEMQEALEKTYEYIEKKLEGKLENGKI